VVAAQAVHLPTLILLFAFMVVSAQMRLGGFYDWVTCRLAALPLVPLLLLGAMIRASALVHQVRRYRLAAPNRNPPRRGSGPLHPVLAQLRQPLGDPGLAELVDAADQRLAHR